MEILRLTSEEELNSFISKGGFLLKHSATCPISAGAYQEFQRYAATASVPLGMIVVQEQRPLSQRVAELTGIKHESPQVLYFQNGKVLWHASHRQITAQALESQVQ